MNPSNPVAKSPSEYSVRDRGDPRREASLHIGTPASCRNYVADFYRAFGPKAAEASRLGLFDAEDGLVFTYGATSVGVPT